MNVKFIKSRIVPLAQKHGLEFVVLFGSQATSRAHEKSDIDIAVISRKKVDTPRLMREMSLILKHSDVQVIDLGKASPTLMYTVVKEGKTLYEKIPNAFFSWKLYAIKIWMETAWLRDMRKMKIRRWTGGSVK